MSTPAASSIVKSLNEEYGEGYCFGGIVLTGNLQLSKQDGISGIRFLSPNGSQAKPSFNKSMQDQMESIQEYHTLEEFVKVTTSIVGEYLMPNKNATGYGHTVITVLDKS